ncbi:Protein export cytoplasm protein SecA ATPase RNA helicase [Labilithrix luteola]|uniref:Protein translocase subunit SecA n=1 Tax=Labilithrix luteola TaxID=1391654 RepID=A0A0K1PR41_9BACT|nr:preprotein translocase subunit SecA [Labilithrix luteola]AKU95992.1 Protein export cytoplasm protein SecA ATPase RNA helicase [Labilithrix luteola]
MLTWALKKILGTSHEREVKKLKPLVEEINKLEPKMAALEEHQLKAKTAELKEKLDNGASLDDILVEAFAVCREASKRHLRMRHYDVQLIGGMVLHKGMIAEMRTGEGKTLVATLACYLNALEGKGVHVVTVNDYLARRDSEWMGKLYGYLGLSTGVVVNQQGDREKRQAYKSDITYGQNNEFGFDYLRDNMKFSALDYAQRELNFAIVDEVDSILIDEARTPLIISGQAEASSDKYKTIDEVIPRLRKDEHFTVDEKAHQVSLTDEGVEQAQKLMGISNLYDPVNLESLHILNQCLKAHSLYKRDVNYLVADDGKVLIIDEFTGRVLPGRRWSDGLHQAVEAKEHVPIQEETRTMATITFQNLFRIYKKLGGMTGTADTEAEEFHKTYKLEVVQIPTNRGIQRLDLEDLVYKTEREKFTAVVGEILEAHEKGRPVLVGTTSVEKSSAIAKILKKKGISHAVLNAKQHEKEAYVVAQAGRKGAITVSTNMAGRGTDIILGGNAEMLAKLDFREQGRDPDTETEDFEKLVLKYEESCKREGDEVREAGGLHIVGTERHESRRIDNQLRGRAGRQGDPGSSRFYLSLEDDLMRIFAGDRVKSLMERMGMPDDEPIEHPWVSKSIQDAQRKVEARNFDIRKNLLEYDDVMNEQRKTVYKVRQQLLLGTYTPEILGDDGKPTGKLRTIETMPGLVDAVKPAVTELLLHFGTSVRTDSPEVKRPTKLEEIELINDLDQLRSEIYNMWGFRIDFKEAEAKDPTGLYQRLLAEVPSSLTQQRERLLDLVDAIVSAVVEESCPANKPPEDWDWKGIRTAFVEHFGTKPKDYDHLHDVQDLAHTLYAQALELVETKEKEMGTELLLRVFRHFYLEDIDKQWVEHLTNMEHLRDGIGLRGYGQRDPKQEYKKEGYDIFVNMMASTSSNVVTKVMAVRLQKESEIERLEREDAARHAAAARSMQLRHGSELAEGEEPPPAQSAPPPRRAPAVQQVRREQPKIGRNDLCPCGSGEKFKKCHGAALEEEGSDDAQA